MALALLVLAAATPAADVTVGRQMNGKTVTMGRNRILAVRLASNATTGYRWSVAAIPPMLLRKGDEYLAPKTRASGAGGEQRLLFRAPARGTGVLRLVYARPWEKGRAPAETYALTVVVR